MPLSNSTFTCLNVNIRSVSKNFGKLKECLKLTNDHDYTVIGLSERILKKNRMSIVTFLDIKWSLLIESVVKRVVYAYTY